jgi:hypothetical protein
MAAHLNYVSNTLRGPVKIGGAFFKLTEVVAGVTGVVA